MGHFLFLCHINSFYWSGASGGVAFRRQAFVGKDWGRWVVCLVNVITCAFDILNLPKDVEEGRNQTADRGGSVIVYIERE